MSQQSLFDEPLPLTSKLQNRINELPKEHEPKAYTVTLRDKRGVFISTRYVRASSPKRAELTAARVEIDVFGGKPATAIARLGV